MASLSAAPGTKIVLVDGARGLAKDLQAFDDIADRQRIVIIASAEEREALDQLKDRGCPIWYMLPEDILIGETSPRNRLRTSFVGATIRAADTWQRVKVTVVDCQDSVLQAVAVSLDRAASMIRENEEAHESEEILARLFGLLCEYSECCFGVGEETKNNLQAVRDQILQYENWMDPEVVRKLQEAAHGLENLTGSGSYGQEKADALLNFILDKHHEPWVVAARSRRTAESLRTEFDNLGVDVPIIPVSMIRPENDYAGIIVPAWLNEQKFARLKSQAVTPDIRVLAYPFESEWISHHQARERARERSNRMEIEMLSSILGIEPRFLTSLGHHELDPSANEDRPDLPIIRVDNRVAQRRIKRPPVAAEGESSREAQLVQFFGDCHALLSEWAELPKLNQLVDKANTNEAKMELVTASELSQGDFVLFKASGDKEFIRLIAENILGAEEYERDRAIADRWRSSLRRLGNSPAEVQQHLKAHGLNRTTATVKGWLDNPDRIGPGDLNDIEHIATAAKDVELLSIREEVGEAISRIRGTHISAGNQLTQLLFGRAWG